MAKEIEYTDIGHSDDRDIIWILTIPDLDFRQRRSGRTGTHEIFWGNELKIEDHWRGRYEISTGYCSIAPPLGLELQKPHSTILDLLKSKFDPTKFYFFSGGVESFSPNPREGE